MPSTTIIYVTCKDEKEAEKIAKSLLQEHLAACANWFPVRSAYLWKGNLEEGSEAAMVVKTQKDKKDAALDHIRWLHSYDVPAIETWEADTDEKASE